MRLLLTAVAVAAAGFAAEPSVAASDLVSMVTSALATDRYDRRMARALSSVRLHERLDEPVIAILTRMGAGPATTRALRKLAQRSAGLPVPSEAPITLVPAPTDSEQAALAGAARRWSAAYVKSLPDFTCTRAARQYRNYKSEKMPMVDDHWHEAGSYSGETTYVRGRDYYRVTMVDGKPFQGSFEKLDRDRSWGEFGGLMVEIMDPSREATLEWDRWEVLRGRRMAVFRYAVDQKHSHYWLRAPVPGAASRWWTLTIAHRGFVYVDPQSGAIARLVLYGSDIPAEYPINATGDVLDYGDVSIAGNRYALPVSAVSYQRTQQRETRAEIEYRDYLKFGTNSTVSFEEK